MNTKLNHVEDWLELAQEANWSVSKMAKLCNVSSRSLERFFLQKMRKTPKQWVIAQRQKQARRLLREGSSVKETAASLGYTQAHHLSREFKAYWGASPTSPAAVKCRHLV